ncbi:MAG TPA: hypothetical protein PKN50_09360 [Spirochaetota bacterium]|nr:hypothetical protein [Spirochaetota bacterium]HPV43619.1 hypothetical protein [Spirochaetota bacterium]
MSFKRWTVCLITLVVCGVLFMALLQYIIDPLQYFRIASFYRPTIDNNYSREFNAAFLKNVDYETIVTGSSLMGNCTVQTINTVLNTRSLNVIIPEATTHEIGLTLARAARIGKLKYCIIGLDLHTLSEDALKTRVEKFPYFLYDDNVLNDYKYLFDFDFFRKSLAHIIINNIIDHGECYLCNIETAYNWINMNKYVANKYVADEQKNLKNWRRSRIITGLKTRKRISDEFYLKGKENFNYNIYPVIKSNPQIQFICMQVPYSILFWINQNNEGRSDGMINLKIYIYNKLRKCGNVRLYDFQSEEAIINNLNNYYDMLHFTEKINDMMIHAVASDRYLVNDDTYRNYQIKFNRLIEIAKLKYK